MPAHVGVRPQQIIERRNPYTDPLLARVGMTQSKVRKSGPPELMAKMAMEDVSCAFAKGETLGFMKILVDAETNEILDASILLGVGGMKSFTRPSVSCTPKRHARCCNAPCTFTRGCRSCWRACSVV
jgi:hypothetical protein